MKRSRIRRRTPIRQTFEADPVYGEARVLVIHRAKGRCERCGDNGSDVHHRQGRGGPDPHNLANCTLLCRSCHSWAHLHPWEAYESGWCVRRTGNDQPADIPLTDTRGRSFLLTEDGQRIPVIRPAATTRGA